MFLKSYGQHLTLTILASFLLGYSSVQAQLTSSDSIVIRKASTAIHHPFIGKKNKEYFRLMNLARTEPLVLQRYLDAQYGKNYSQDKAIMSLVALPSFKARPLLKPSTTLHSTAWIHAIISGLTSYEGHRWLTLRMILGLNFTDFLPGTYTGENCDYGNREPQDAFLALMNSPGHRANILDKHFKRVGVVHAFHFQYGVSYVSSFAGKEK